MYPGYCISQHCPSQSLPLLWHPLLETFLQLDWRGGVVMPSPPRDKLLPFPSSSYKGHVYTPSSHISDSPDSQACLVARGDQRENKKGPKNNLDHPHTTTESHIKRNLNPNRTSPNTHNIHSSFSRAYHHTTLL